MIDCFNLLVHRDCFNLTNNIYFKYFKLQNIYFKKKVLQNIIAVKIPYIQCLEILCTKEEIFVVFIV